MIAPALLTRLPLFAGCSKRDLRALARRSHSVMVDAGATLFTEGAPSTAAYVIVAGTAEVRGRGRKIATLGPGDVVGELGLLLDRPRNATVTALTSIDALEIGRADLKKRGARDARARLDLARDRGTPPLDLTGQLADGSSI